MEQNLVNAMVESEELIAEFLKENGGSSNGYSTYAEGEVKFNTYGSIKWHTTRGYDDLTIRQVKVKGAELYEKLVSVLREYDIGQINISYKHIEDGCNGVYVQVKSKGIKLEKQLYESCGWYEIACEKRIKLK